MAEDDNVIIEGLGKGKITPIQVIAIHLDRILKAASAPLTFDENAKDTFYNSVRALDAALSMYKDDDFEADKKKIMALSDPKDSIASIDEYYLWLGLLVKLIGKAGFFPAEEIKLMDDDKSDIILA